MYFSLKKTHCICYIWRIFRNFFRRCWFFFKIVAQDCFVCFTQGTTTVAIDQEIGPNGFDKTSFMSRFLLCEIMVIILKRSLPAFNMISLFFATIFSDFNVLKDFNFIFGKISKNFIVLSPESLFVIKSTNAWSPFSLAANISVTTSFSGEAPGVSYIDLMLHS